MKAIKFYQEKKFLSWCYCVLNPQLYISPMNFIERKWLMLNNLSGICVRVQQRLVNQSNALWFTSLISIYKHCAIDTADPSSMQVMCHMTFIIDLAHCGVFVAQSIGARNPKESKGLRFDSSWGLRIFFVPHS